MSKLSPQKRAKIASLHEAGMSDPLISQQVGCSRKAVARWKNELVAPSPFQDRVRPGRPHKLTCIIKKKIIKMTQGKRRKSTRLVALQLKQQKVADISHQSVCRTLKEAGLHPYKRPKKPRLLQRHLRQRRAWLKGTNNSMWSKVVFSDEKIFFLSRSANRSHDIV